MRPEDERDDADIETLLRALDHPPPAVTADDVIARARRAGGRWSRWAAGIVLAIATAGVAYAVPGSPLPGWLDAIASRGDAAAARQPDPGQAGVARDEDVAGIAWDPAESLVILFPSAAGAHVRVSLTDADTIVARAAIGAARFTFDPPNRWRIDLLSPDTVAVLIPRSARRVEIIARGRRAFLKDGDELAATRAPLADGVWVLPLDPSAR